MTRVSGITIGRQARTLATALLLTGLSISVLGGAAYAESKQPPKDSQQVYCVRTNPDGEPEVFLPGEFYTKWVNGRKVKVTCGGDGTWSMSRTEGVNGPGTSGGVYAP